LASITTTISEPPPLTFEPAPQQQFGKLKTFIQEKEIAGFRGEITPSGRANLFGASVLQSVIEFPSRTFQFGKAIATQPVKTITGIPSGVVASAQEFGTQLASPTPETALGTLTGEVLVLKGTGKAIGVAGKGFELGSARFSTKFVSTGDVALGTGTGLKGIKIKTKVPVVFEAEGFRQSFKFADDLVVTQKFDIPFAPSPISKVAEPVSLQIGRAGETIKAVSAQTDFPLGAELDRLLFFDPKGRLRTSRLGIGVQKEASLSDIFSGDVTFRKGRPQALFGDFPVAKPPQDILAKLSAGKPLTQAELKRFGQFVETPTGQLKPVPQFRERGFGAVEPEVTFGTGEIPFKKGLRGKAIIKGRRVDIIEIGVKQFTKETQKAFDDIAKALGGKDIGGLGGKGIDDLGKGGLGTGGLGTLSEKQLQASLKTLSKETGFSVGELSSQFVSPKPFVSLPKLSTLSGLSLSRLGKGKGVSGGLAPPSKVTPSLKVFKTTFTPTGFIPSSPRVPPPPILKTGITIPTFEFDPFQTQPRKKKTPKRIRGSAERKRRQRERKLLGRERLIRPSFTAIVQASGIRPKGQGREFERPAFTTKVGRRDVGISPFSLRGTKTGFVKQRKTIKKKVSRKRSSLDFGFTNL